MSLNMATPTSLASFGTARGATGHFRPPPAARRRLQARLLLLALSACSAFYLSKWVQAHLRGRGCVFPETSHPTLPNHEFGVCIASSSRPPSPNGLDGCRCRVLFIQAEAESIACLTTFSLASLSDCHTSAIRYVDSIGLKINQWTRTLYL
ncbi:hypothetical protein BKA93DRAFT_274990 [Sparassis latifolia]